MRPQPGCRFQLHRMLIGVKIMFKQKTSSLESAQQGVILLEALIAILIFSFAVLGIVGLQAAMVKNTTDAKYRAEAGYIAQQEIGQIWANPDPSGAGYVDPSGVTNIPSLLPAGTLTVTRSSPVIITTVDPPPAYTYTVTVLVQWRQPGPDQTIHNFTTTASIAGD